MVAGIGRETVYGTYQFNGPLFPKCKIPHEAHEHNIDGRAIFHLVIFAGGCRFLMKVGIDVSQYEPVGGGAKDIRKDNVGALRGQAKIWLK